VAASVIPIHDMADPRLAPYRAVRERDLAREDGLFILEGEVVLRQALAHGRFPPVSVLLSEARAKAAGGLLAAIPAGTPVYSVPAGAMEAIAGFHVHRGALAVAARGRPSAPPELIARLPADALVVACIGIANHDNLGGVFRNAAAFAADAVLLDGTSCDPLYRKAIRVSVGAALAVPYARGGSGPDLMAALAGAGFRLLGLSPSGAGTLAAIRPEGRTALVLGTEGPGLVAGILAATETVRIPMSERIDSLNLATASGIALAALFAMRQESRRAAP
jgi:tRNA G18 (ribose-2'-O)-methylase SpoU